MAKKKYLLLGGTHTDVDGTTYVFDPNKETVIESDTPLNTTFRDHFRDYADDTLPANSPKAKRGAAKLGVTTDDPAVAPRSVAPPDYATIAAASRTPVKAESEAAEEGEEVEPPPGDDHTDEFEGASDLGLLVHKEGRVYSIYDASNPSEPLNDEEFTTKGEVKSFIADRKGEA